MPLSPLYNPSSRPSASIRFGSIEVRITERGYAVFARRSFERGELVLRVMGEVTDEQDIYTIQIAPDQHLRPLPPAKFLNHSCNPNLGVKTSGDGIPDFYAFRDIAIGDELTFDYAMTEYEIVASDVVCRCGAEQCRGHLGAWRTLPTLWRERYRGFVADYLLDMPL